MAVARRVGGAAAIAEECRPLNITGHAAVAGGRASHREGYFDFYCGHRLAVVRTNLIGRFGTN